MPQVAPVIYRHQLQDMSGSLGGLDAFQHMQGGNGLRAVLNKDGELTVQVIEIDVAGRRQTRYAYLSAHAASSLVHTLQAALQARGALVPLETEQEQAAREAERLAVSRSEGLVDFDDLPRSAA